MTQENLLVLVILVVEVILFVSERLRVDLIAMMVLITLSLTGFVTSEEAFSGFASPAVITVWSIYIVSGALFRSGVADTLANFMLRLAGHSYLRLLFVIMVEMPTCYLEETGKCVHLVSVCKRESTKPSKRKWYI